MTETISRLLAGGAAEAAAIRGTNDRPRLTYGGLRELCTRTVRRLNFLGIGRDDRVAIVLPNGPEMAAAFLAIGAGATTAPLNPAYRAEEFTFYLTDLKAKALVVLHGMATDAREVAARLAIPVLDLVPGEAAGDFTLEGGSPGNPAKPGRRTRPWCCTPRAPRRGRRSCR
jgi:acyl-CoA synthetase (AMP-forming)/AMP-acid ligase II